MSSTKRKSNIEPFKLNHLVDETCDGCGSETVAIEKNGRHCNGEWFETRRFSCGARIKFVPNYSRVEVDTPCPNTEKNKLMMIKRRTALESLQQYIEKLDVDKDCKQRLVDAFKYFNIGR